MSQIPTTSKRNQDKQHTPSLISTWCNIQEKVNSKTENKNASESTPDEETILEEIENNIVQSTPTMVFSVIGDSDSFVPRPWPITVFQTALIEAAKSGGETWILYRGKADGVSKVVRDAYQSYKDLEFKAKEVKRSDPDLHVKLICLAGKEEVSSDKDLPYDTKTQRDDSFLLAFEKFVSEQDVFFFSEKMDIKMPVPIAIIVCEGDLETIAHISKALEKKLPVIIMKGSGMAADLVLDYLDNPKVLRKKSSLLFGIRFDENKYHQLEEHLKNIADKDDLVGVFDLERDDPLMLSNIVGEAVVSCWSMENILQIDINDGDGMQILNTKGLNRSNSAINAHTIKGTSLAWKLLRRNSVRPEEKNMKQLLEAFKKKSRPYVLSPKYSTPTSLPLYFYFGYQLLQESELMKKCGHVLLLEALKANRCDYVRVLLNKEVKVKLADLPELYAQTVSCQICKFKKDDCLHMQWVLKQIQETHAKTMCHKYNNLVNKIEDKKKKNKAKYFKKLKELQPTVANAATGLCRKILRYKRHDDKFKNEENTNANNREDEIEDANTSDILLWAIFANRKELAEICWLRSEHHLLTGLICSAILSKLSKKASNVKEQILSKDLEEHSKLFEQRCIAIMDGMYEEDTQQAIDLMDDEADVWGICSSPLTFAYENFMYDVVAHTCSQKNMNKQWYNKLAPDLKPFLKSAFSKPKRFFIAPLTKYVFNYMLFFTMLVMYSAFVLTSISTKYYEQDIARIFEYYVYFWGVGDFIEEMISCFGCLESRGQSHRSYYSRMKRYLYDFWNVVDLLSYALLIAALFVRHFYIDETFTIARRMFALSLLVMYLRFLEVFLIHRRLGPTLIMIKEMLKDLLSFLFIALFVVLGVGIYYHANLWPDHQTIFSGDWTNWRIWTIIYYPYWQLYAELNLESLDGSEQSDCTNVTAEWEADTSNQRCPQEDWTVPAVAAIYLLFSNLLLVNLVIAMFSYTFERVQENSEKLWRFQRYTVINDYDWRIPSPINLIFLPYRFLCCPAKKDCCLQTCDKKCNRKKVMEREEKIKSEKKFRKNFQKIIALRNHNKI